METLGSMLGADSTDETSAGRHGVPCSVSHVLIIVFITGKTFFIAMSQMRMKKLRESE